MKSKFIVICGNLILALLFSNISACTQSPDTLNYEKDYHRFVDSKEPLARLMNKDNQLCYSDFSAMVSRMPKPSHTVKYGSEKLQ